MQEWKRIDSSVKVIDQLLVRVSLLRWSFSVLPFHMSLFFKTEGIDETKATTLKRNEMSVVDTRKIQEETDVLRESEIKWNDLSVESRKMKPETYDRLCFRFMYVLLKQQIWVQFWSSLAR